MMESKRIEGKRRDRRNRTESVETEQRRITVEIDNM